MYMSFTDVLLLILMCIKSNQIVLVTCPEFNRCRTYSEMLTYKPLTNNEVQEIDIYKIKYFLNKLKFKKVTQEM
jgi:hypothetical protein